MLLRLDQRQAVDRIARTLGLSVSDVTRWMIDQSVAAIEGTGSFQTLQAMKAMR